MIIENLRSKKKFNVTNEEWDVITKDGNDYKYRVVEAEAPLEVKSLRKKISEEKEKTKK